MAGKRTRWESMDHSEEPLYHLTLGRSVTRASGPIADFLTKKKAEREPKTYRWYHEALMAYWQFLESQELGLIKDFNEDSVNAFRVHLRERGCKENTVSNRLRALRAFARWMKGKGWVEDYPLGDLRVPQTTKPEFDLIRDEDRQALFNLYPPTTYLGSRNLAMLGVLSDTGLRREEVVNLKLKNLDLDGGVLKVYADKTERWRYLPLTPQLISLLHNYLTLRARYFSKPSKPRLNRSQNRRMEKPRVAQEDYLFLGWNGKAMKPQALGLILWRASKKIGTRIHAHLFRHDQISRKCLDGENPAIVQRWAGHKTFEMTAFYVNLAEDMLGAIKPKSSVLAGITLPGVKRRGRRPTSASH